VLARRSVAIASEEESLTPTGAGKMGRVSIFSICLIRAAILLPLLMRLGLDFWVGGGSALGWLSAGAEASTLPGEIANEECEWSSKEASLQLALLLLSSCCCWTTS